MTPWLMSNRYHLRYYGVPYYNDFSTNPLTNNDYGVGDVLVFSLGCFITSQLSSEVSSFMYNLMP